MKFTEEGLRVAFFVRGGVCFLVVPRGGGRDGLAGAASGEGVEKGLNVPESPRTFLDRLVVPLTLFVLGGVGSFPVSWAGVRDSLSDFVQLLQ
ncbi:MAG: hypothetical protein ACYS47_08810 [Planctomycetota bacterium]